jgi:hypothetical protein
VALAWALGYCVVHYWLMRLQGPMSMERRALWMQAASRRVIAGVGIRYRVEGQPPISILATKQQGMAAERMRMSR